MAGHALLAPSSAQRWLECPASVKESMGKDNASIYAAEGSCAHLVLECHLTPGMDAPGVGTEIEFDGFAVAVTQEMHDCARYFETAMQPDTFKGWLAESKVSLEPITGEKGAEGTADFIGLDEPRLVVADYKYGKGVKVYAKDNPQLMLYALASLLENDLIYEFERVEIVVVQPRLDHVDKWEISAADLRAWGDKISCKAEIALGLAEGSLAIEPFIHYTPSESACRFCAAKPTCPALYREIVDAFEDLDAPALDAPSLGACLEKAKLAELWAKAVREEAISRLKQAQPVDGWKLVQGRPGNRAWVNAQSVHDALDSMRVPKAQRFKKTLISPTQAEKDFGDQPRRWARLEALITRPEGKPTLAPSTDPRPAIDPVGAFENLEKENVE